MRGSGIGFLILLCLLFLALERWLRLSQFVKTLWWCLNMQILLIRRDEWGVSVDVRMIWSMPVSNPRLLWPRLRALSNHITYRDKKGQLVNEWVDSYKAINVVFAFYRHIRIFGRIMFSSYSLHCGILWSQDIGKTLQTAPACGGKTGLDKFLSS